MNTIDSVLFAKTGIMTQREIMKKCTSVGSRLSEKLLVNHDLSPAEIYDVINKTLGDCAQNFKISFTKEELNNELVKKAGLSDAAAKKITESVVAYTMPNYKEKYVYINFPSNLSGENIVNIVPHELEHALYMNYSLKGKYAQVYNNNPNSFNKVQSANSSQSSKLFKINQNKRRFAMSIITEFQQYLIRLINFNNQKVGLSQSSATLNEDLLQKTGTTSLNELKEKIRTILYAKRLLAPGRHLANAFNLRILQENLKDEVNAYLAGGLSQKKLYEMRGENITGRHTYSEVVSQLFKSALETINDEIDHVFFNNLKKIFGLKENNKFEDSVLKYIYPNKIS